MNDIWAGIAAVAAMIAAIMNLYQTRKLKQTFESDLFSKILEELGSEDARRDRAIMAKSSNWKPTYASMTEKIGEPSSFDKDSDAFMSPEMALDRTIPRLDRVGYFILGDADKLPMHPPAWLWDMVEKIWEYSDSWIEFRTSPENKAFYSEYYGRYFKRLHDYYKRERCTLREHYSDCLGRSA